MPGAQRLSLELGRVRKDPAQLYSFQGLTPTQPRALPLLSPRIIATPTPTPGSQDGLYETFCLEAADGLDDL